MYKSKRFWIGLGVVALTLLIAFQGIRFDLVLEALGRINYWYAPVTMIALLASFTARVYRWQLLFSPYHVRWSKVFSTLTIGYFLSNITPLRVGDVVRAYLIATIERVPVPRALSSVLIERTSDALTIVLFLIALLPIVPNIPAEARSFGTLFGIAGLGLMIALAVLSLNRERGLNLMKRLTSRIRFLQRESVWRAIESLIDGFSVLHSIRPLLGVVAWSIIVWLFAALLNWIVMLAMGMNLGFEAAALVIVVASFAVTAVPTPGQLGVFHLAVQSTLTTVYAVDKSVALAYAFVIHAYVYLTLMVLGTLFIWREGLSYGKLQAVESRAQ